MGSWRHLRDDVRTMPSDPMMKVAWRAPKYRRPSIDILQGRGWFPPDLPAGPAARLASSARSRCRESRRTRRRSRATATVRAHSACRPIDRRAPVPVENRQCRPARSRTSHAARPCIWARTSTSSKGGGRLGASVVGRRRGPPCVLHRWSTKRPAVRPASSVRSPWRRGRTRRRSARRPRPSTYRVPAQRPRAWTERVCRCGR
jgi:hypothetical protein